MYPNALQIDPLKLSHIDNATLLSFMHMVHNHGLENATMREKMGQWWTDFSDAYQTYDQVINPERRSLLSEDLEGLDNARDNALGAYHEALLALQRHPNTDKRQAARQLLLSYETFNPDRAQEYMKESELIDQAVKEINERPELTAAVTLLDLDDYVTDLNTKNQAFVTTMASRTASTEGQTTGVVAAARADVEAKYQLLRRLLNVAATYEGDTDYRPFILSVNAEVEHFKDILARKGVSTGSSSNAGTGTGNSGNSGANGQNGQNGSNGTTDSGNQGGTSGGDNGGSSQGGSTGGDNGGSTGGDNGGSTGGDNGGSSGGGDNGGGGGSDWGNGSDE